MKENTLMWLFMDSNKLAMDECEEKETIHLKEYKENEEKLLATLNEEQKTLFNSFRYDFLYHILTVRDKECSHIIFECLQIGMEFQKFLNCKDEERGDTIPLEM